MSSTPIDPTPALIPLALDESKPAHDEVAVNSSPSYAPIKPQRKKKGSGPPPVPAPYAGPRKIATKVSLGGREREKEEREKEERERERGERGGGRGR